MTWSDAEGVAQERSIGHGLAILVGAGSDSTPADAHRLAEKTANLRLFRDAAGRTNLSLLDVGGSALVVSQFTLYADLSRGRRPSFLGAGDPDQARARYQAFADHLHAQGVLVETGSFGAEMVVSIENDGPVTLVLSTDDWPTRV